MPLLGNAASCDDRFAERSSSCKRQDVWHHPIGYACLLPCPSPDSSATVRITGPLQVSSLPAIARQAWRGTRT